MQQIMKKHIPQLKYILAFVATGLLFLQSIAQDWDIPAKSKTKNSFIKFTPELAKEGEAIFTKNCQQCHGIPETGTSLKTLKPIPPDLGTNVTQARTDGDLFYIITTGRLVMPSFKNIFTEEDRWKLISYLRSFNKKYIQVLSKTDPSKSKLVKIKLEFDSTHYILKADIKAYESNETIALKEDEVSLFAERYFGKLQLDKTQKTNLEGIAVFTLPKDLPGDKDGMVNLTISVSDDIYGEIESLNKLKIGIPTDKPSLTDKRAIWNVVTKAPIWIIVTYTSIVLLVTAALIYILMRLKKLRDFGKNV
jgi:mono/diheme cytochrome c family protein